MNNEQCLLAFLDRKTNRRTERCDFSGSTVYTKENGRVYLLYKSTDEVIAFWDGDTIIMTADRIGSASNFGGSSAPWRLRKLMEKREIPYGQVSFSAIQSFTTIESVKIIDTSEDVVVPLTKDDNDNYFDSKGNPFAVPIAGEIRPIDDNNNYEYHLVGAVLFSCDVRMRPATIVSRVRNVPIRNEDHKLPSTTIRFICLSAMDEQSYFVSLLDTEERSTIDTVEKGFESLIPVAVRNAKRLGLEVKRQGEWFFVNTGTTIEKWEEIIELKGIRKRLRYHPIEEDTVNAGNRHIWRTIPLQKIDNPIRGLSTRSIRLWDTSCFDDGSFSEHPFTLWKLTGIPTVGKVLASGRWGCGTVKHVERFSYRRTGEHRNLQLDDEHIWIAVRNTEYASFSAEGRVD